MLFPTLVNFGPEALAKDPSLRLGGFDSVAEMADLKSLGPEFKNLSNAQRSQVMDKLNELQYRDTLDTYNGLVDRCFNECVLSFKSKDLSRTESSCIETCVKLFFDYSQRVGARFAENQGRFG
ncbi:bifunctional Tim10-like domain superfamily/Tim10-like [Babesia duncani]|uniref:Mitochondrial import inner membrane translocase subunit n=1 Tax=Babesia duncani TaxID=323732 RepID=A0AAD9PKW5_9APIC|nr:bifunctional Tim10-like domain superfamily/Tim10-like [Babesia duncani]